MSDIRTCIQGILFHPNALNLRASVRLRTSQDVLAATTEQLPMEHVKPLKLQGASRRRDIAQTPPPPRAMEVTVLILQFPGFSSAYGKEKPILKLLFILRLL